MACDFAGAIEMDFAVEYALDTLKKKMAQARANRSSPEPDPGMTADHVCYNLAAYPISFDFLPWLVDAEMTRRREKAPSPLKVAFSYGRDLDTGFNTEYRKNMMAGVIWPLLGLIGAVEDPKAIKGRSKQMYVYKDVTKASRNGEEVPRFKPSDLAVKTIQNYAEDEVVTITLREAEHWPHRNSNIEEWVKFALYLEEQGETVVFVRDTCKAMEPLINHRTCPRASVNLDVRMALYESAKCNLFVANGPWNLALFGTRPWLMFNEISDSDQFIPNTPKWWKEFQGINPGEQFPWSQSDQRIVWESDSYENLCKAWKELNDHTGTSDNADRTTGAAVTGVLQSRKA